MSQNFEKVMSDAMRQVPASYRSSHINPLAGTPRAGLFNVRSQLVIICISPYYHVGIGNYYHQNGAYCVNKSGLRARLSLMCERINV